MFISHKTGGERDLNIQKALTSYPGPVNRTGSSHLGQTLIGLDLERLEFIFGNVSTAVWSPVCPQTYVNMCHLMSHTLARKQQPTDLWFQF